MRCTPHGLQGAVDPLWFCLRAEPKREHIAAETLRRQFALTCFAPRIRFLRPTERGAAWFTEAMFPGYLFAEFIYAEFHRRICATPGVVSLVRFGDCIPSIEPEAIALIRQASSDNEVVTITQVMQPGDSVVVIDGPFHGLNALVTHLHPAGDRLRILLEFLGRQIETDVPVSRVLPGENSGGRWRAIHAHASSRKPGMTAIPS
jgi:transcriptional antiterminator RfaH